MKNKPIYPKITIENYKHNMSAWFCEKTFKLNEDISKLINTLNNKLSIEQKNILENILKNSLKLFAVSTGIDYNKEDCILLFEGVEGYKHFLYKNNIDKKDIENLLNKD